MVQLSVYIGSHLSHAAPLVLPSLEDDEVEVIGNMWVTLHHSAMTKSFYLLLTDISKEWKIFNAVVIEDHVIPPKLQPTHRCQRLKPLLVVISA